MKQAEERLRKMLEIAGIPVKASYDPGEVRRILGISRATWYRMVGRFEPDRVDPSAIDAYTLRRHHRVSHQELVEWLGRNRAYERRNAVDPRQMVMFGE